MNAHEKRTAIFDRIFKFDPAYNHKVFSQENVDSKTLNKIIKRYAPDAVPESVLGMYYPKKSKRNKAGILFTDYKIYCSFKRGRNYKIWYDEIVNAQTGFLSSKKLTLTMDDGSRIKLKTTARLSKKICDFIKEINFYNDDVGEYNGKIKFDTTKASIPGAVTGAEALKRNIINRSFSEEKYHGSQGHGFAAEDANNLVDRIMGKKATVIGGDNLKDGPDRRIIGKDGATYLIQTKYCRTAADSINACFNENGFRYDGMSIEVPKDQYDEALKIVDNLIKQGKITDINGKIKAEDIVRKGHITYKQAVNIAKAGTVESLVFDSINGVVACSSSFGISAAVALATSVWSGEEFNVAVKNAVQTGMKVGGASFLTSVIASQLSKAGLNSLLVGSTTNFAKALGKTGYQAIANTFRTSAISGGAALNSAAKILRNNFITSLIFVFVFAFFDLINLIRRRISFKQFIKNFIVLVISVFAGSLGGIAGGAVGVIIIPGIGAFLGALIGGFLAGSLAATLAQKVLGVFIKDDVEKMINILNEEFRIIRDDYLLSGNEVEKISDKLAAKLDKKTFYKMIASKDKHQFARNLLKPIVNRQLKKRKKIVEPDKQTMLAIIKQIADEGNATV